METLWTANPSLARASRWWIGSSRAAPTTLSAQEIIALTALGLVAAIATSAGNLGIPLPGHSILRGTLPLMLGMSLVPRRGSGTIMSAAAALGLVVIRLGGLGGLNAAAATGLVCLGPILDAALARATPGWRLYGRVAAAGATANLVAFAIRMGAALWLGEVGGGRGFLAFWPIAMVSFLGFGAAAGLLSALAWFRANPTPRADR